MTELGQVEIKRRLLSGVVDCELLSDTYELISALQAEILELKANAIVKDERIGELTEAICKLPAELTESRRKRVHHGATTMSVVTKPSMYKTRSERDDD